MFAGTDCDVEFAYYSDPATESEDDDSDMSDTTEPGAESTVRAVIARQRRPTGFESGRACPHASFRWIHHTLVNKLPRLHLREQSNSILKLNYSILIKSNQMDIRKISVGPDFKSGAMHYLVGQEILNGQYFIHHIQHDPGNNSFKIWIQRRRTVTIHLSI